MSDYVYFVRPIGMRGPIKIGYSNYPQRRLGELFVWSPFPLEIVVTVPGTRKLELNIQECLVQSRSHQEWFHATDETIGLIEKLLDGIPVEEAIDLSARRGRMAAKRRRSEQTKGPKTIAALADEARRGATIEQAARTIGVKVTTPFEKVIEKVGSQCKLADLLGIKQSTVSYWAKTGIPAERAVELENATGGLVPRSLARPDLWDAPFRGIEAPQAPRAGDKEAGVIR